MTPRRFMRIMRAQVETLRREDVIDAGTFAVLSARYETAGWNWLSLGRWLLLFGTVSVAAGLYFFALDFVEWTPEKLAVALGIGVAAAFGGAQALRLRGLTWSRRSLELLGGILLIGLTFVLGYIFSSGSGNWPALLLIDLLLLVPLAYLLNNVLVLILSVVVFFTWIAGVGVLHRFADVGLLARYRDFFKVWLFAGIFFCEMALWLMSLFGNFGEIDVAFEATAGELWLFNLLWAGGNALLLYLGSRYGLRMLRGYAVTFLIIQAYTVYFWHIAGYLGSVLATFIAGVVSAGLVVHLEKKRRSSR